MKFTLLAAAAILAAPAVFAQTALPDENTYLVGPTTTRTPGNSPISARTIPGSAIGEEHGVVTVVAVNGTSSTAVMGAGPAMGNRYWFNVPKDIDQRQDFRRWLGLQ